MKKVLIIILVILVIIQFIPSGLPDNNPVAGQDIHDLIEVSEDVSLIFKNACYDCHSQEVIYPWYSYVAPVSFLVARDVKVGRAQLDFSLWGTLSKRKQLKALDEIAEEVNEGNMPLPIYPPLHPEAKLTQEDKDLIVEWVEQTSEKVLE
ncbi:MAG: heme-binding domain-containing protein [Bacteroidales bacterium]|nr:heme-binding domain-containing protein [Bacteroidales bacterium]